jgi:hypothetical protein
MSAVPNLGHAALLRDLDACNYFRLRLRMWWGGLVDAVEIASRFGLGHSPGLSDGPVARGRQGLVWRLDSAEGRWAVKVLFHQSGEDEVSSATMFQEAACAAGVPTPGVRRTTEGSVFATAASDLSPRSVGRQCLADGRRRSVRHRLGEQRPALPPIG